MCLVCVSVCERERGREADRTPEHLISMNAYKRIMWGRILEIGAIPGNINYKITRGLISHSWAYFNVLKCSF